VIAAVIVAAGFLLGVAPSSTVPANVAPSGLSLFYGFLSSLFIAFHAVLIKSSLPYCNNSTIQLAYWTNLGSAIFLFPFVLLHNEFSTLEDLVHDSTWDGQVFLWGSIVTGIFGFLLCIAGLLSIKVTSPITHMFSSVSHTHCIQRINGCYGIASGRKIRHSNSVRRLAIERHHDGVCTSLLTRIKLTEMNCTSSQQSRRVHSRYHDRNYVRACGVDCRDVDRSFVPVISFYTWIKSLEAAPPPRKDVDLEAMGTRKPEEEFDDGDVTVVFEEPEEEKA